MSMVTVGIASGISAAGSLIGGIFGSIGANSRARAAARKKKVLEDKLVELQNDRQEIINPFEGVTNLSGMLSNPMANLGVATQAAEMQVEEADISLANTLDTIRATGAGAGGATALAQAALQSKKGVSASIEKQEANNEQARAQGEQQLQQQRMQEGQRVQGLQIGEGGRVQGMEMQGKQFAFQAKENREGAQLDRISTQLSGAEARQAQASSDRTGAITGAISGLSSVAGAYYGQG